MELRKKGVIAGESLVQMFSKGKTIKYSIQGGECPGSPSERQRFASVRSIVQKGPAHIVIDHARGA